MVRSGSLPWAAASVASIDAGRGSTRNGRRILGISVRGVTWAAISCNAATCAIPSSSSVNNATCVSRSPRARKPRPGGKC